MFLPSLSSELPAERAEVSTEGALQKEKLCRPFSSNSQTVQNEEMFSRNLRERASIANDKKKNSPHFQLLQETLKLQAQLLVQFARV